MSNQITVSNEITEEIREDFISEQEEMMQQSIRLLADNLGFDEAVKMLKLDNQYNEFVFKVSVFKYLQEIEGAELFNHIKGRRITLTVDDDGKITDYNLMGGRRGRGSTGASPRVLPPVEVILNGKLYQGSSADICRALDEAGVECPVQEGTWFRDNTNLKKLIKDQIEKVGGSWRDSSYKGAIKVTEVEE